jgi:trans-aconitate 2-methyltransferase
MDRNPMADWSARQYLKFEDERTRPARDLLAQVPREAARLICDLGCGPGNSTELLGRRFAHATVIGVDSSPDMLRQAGVRLPDCTFIAADLRDWVPPEDVDILFSNATFQWVPDHLPVLRRLLAALRPGGVLAVQMPDNVEEPSHLLMREVARSGPWAARLAGARPDRAPLPPVGVYYDQLRPVCSRLDLWHTFYHHQLEDAPAIVEWVKGTGLRPYLDPLPDDQRTAFIHAYTARIAASYLPQADGKVLLRFPRLFMVAVK